MSLDVLAEHRAAAQLTRCDVDDLDPFAAVVDELRAAATDGDLDRAAVRLGVLLSLLPPGHVLLLAARIGIEVGDLRRQHRADLVEASHDIAAGVAELRVAVEAGGTEVVQPGVGRERRGMPGEFGVPFEVIEQRRGGPRPPVRCDHCHHRLSGAGHREAAA